MGDTKRPTKKAYRRPVVKCYGNLRTLTGGGGKASTESATPGNPKTKMGAG